MSNQYIILVSPTRDNEIQLVKELGYKTILLRKELSFNEILEVDVPIEIDLNNETLVLDRCLELSRNYDIISVFTMNEYRIPLASKIGELLNLKYILSYEAALCCRNKKLTRQRLNAAGIGPVQYLLLNSKNDLTSQLRGFDFPLIVKPSNDSGSKNVYQCQNIQEVKKAINNILQSGKNNVGQAIDPEILIEELLDGPEFSVESVTVNGDTSIIGITEKIVTSFPHSIEIGHDFPANLNKNQELEIKKLVRESLAVIGVDFAVTHTEVKLTKKGARIVEINARPGGDEIPHLVQVVTGVDLKTLALYVTLGKGINSLSFSLSGIPSASIRFFLANEEGEAYFDRNFHSDHIKKNKWYIQNGQLVKKTESNFDRLGYFIVYGDEENCSSQKANYLQEKLKVTIKKPFKV